MSEEFKKFIGRKGQGGKGKDSPTPTPPPAPPKPDGSLRASPENPRFIMTLVGDTLSMEVYWPKGYDMSTFAKLMSLLINGDLIGPISQAVAITGNINQEQDKAAAIHRFLVQNLSGGRKKKRSQNPDRPVVLPSEAIRWNMQPHRV